MLSAICTVSNSTKNRFTKEQEEEFTVFLEKKISITLPKDIAQSAAQSLYRNTLNKSVGDLVGLLKNVKDNYFEVNKLIEEKWFRYVFMGKCFCNHDLFIKIFKLLIKNVYYDYEFT